MVDPLQWWGALTQQFQQIAAGAMKDAAAQAARHGSGGRRGKEAPAAGTSGRQGCEEAAGKCTPSGGAKRARPKKAPAPIRRHERAMKLFPFGHATHPQWQMAAGLVLAQLRAQMALPDYASAPTLGLLYITDHYAPAAQDILDHLGAELPEVTDWSGTVGVGIASSQRRVFRRAGAGGDAVRAAVATSTACFPASRRWPWATAWASSRTPRWSMPTRARPTWPSSSRRWRGRTATGYLFGGLASSRSEAVQFAIGGNGNIKGQGAAGGVFRGGLSGVAFGAGVALVSRVTQGCQPVGRAQRDHRRAKRNLIIELDGEPALDVLLRDTGISLDQPASRDDARCARRWWA